MRTDISAVFAVLCALCEVILLGHIEYLTEICAAKLLPGLRLNLLLGVFVFVFIIFPLILIGYNILGYGNSQYP